MHARTHARTCGLSLRVLSGYTLHNTCYVYTSNILISCRNIFSYLIRVPPNLTNAILLSSRLSSKNIKTVNENKKREREKKKKPNCRLYRDQLPPLTESVESLPHYLCLMSFTYYPHCHGGKKGNGGKIA